MTRELERAHNIDRSQKLVKRREKEELHCDKTYFVEIRAVVEREETETPTMRSDSNHRRSAQQERGIQLRDCARI
jgi:hypothetical protein